MFALLIFGEYSVSSVPMSSVPTDYWSEAFYNAFPAPWLDKHVSSLAQIIVWVKLGCQEHFLGFLKFIHSPRSGKQGHENIFEEPNKRTQEGLKKDLNQPEK